MDSATKIYREILKGGEAGLNQMIQRKQAESQLLEFKEASNTTPLDKSDKKNLLKEVSAFANADGGVIVWGVKCNKNSEMIDVATELKPIRRVAQFFTEIENQLPQLVYPFPNVENSIIASEEEESGYVVTCVPYWDGLPVRSEIQQGMCDFYIRTGNQVSRMGYNAIADRFGRRPLPKLKVEGLLRIAEDHHELRLSIANHGRGLAKYVAVTIPIPNFFPAPQASWPQASGVTTIIEPFAHTNTCFEASHETVIHAGCSRRFFYSVNLSQSFIHKFITTGLKLPYRVDCEGYSHTGTLISEQTLDSKDTWLLKESETPESNKLVMPTPLQTD